MVRGLFFVQDTYLIAHGNLFDVSRFKLGGNILSDGSPRVYLYLKPTDTSAFTLDKKTGLEADA